MNQLAIEYAADQVTSACANMGPSRGYTASEYNGRPRLEAIAGMVDALHGERLNNELFDVSDRKQFDAVSNILEWNNCHTENLAFALAYGDIDTITNALQTVHYMGQSYAIDAKLTRPELAR